MTMIPVVPKSDLFFSVKYLGPAWPLCIFPNNGYSFPFTPAWLNRRTASCLARSYARQDIWPLVKFPKSNVLDNKLSEL